MAAHEVLVSIQARGAEANPRLGHLAAAVLGDSSTVLVPTPPPALLDPLLEYEVLTIPVPLDIGQPVERLPIWCHNVMLAGSQNQPIALVLKLSRPSRYPATITAFNGRVLADALNATNGDLWRAMENAGMVRAGLAAGPPQAVFDALPDLERRQRRGVFRTHRHAKPGDVALSVCKILCICDPG